MRRSSATRSTALMRSRSTAARSNSKPLGGQVHVLFQVVGDGVGVALHEHDDLVDDLGVVFAAGVAGAGGDAPVDVILQAGARVGRR